MWFRKPAEQAAFHYTVFLKFVCFFHLICGYGTWPFQKFQAWNNLYDSLTGFPYLQFSSKKLSFCFSVIIHVWLKKSTGFVFELDTVQKQKTLYKTSGRSHLLARTCSEGECALLQEGEGNLRTQDCSTWMTRVVHSRHGGAVAARVQHKKGCEKKSEQVVAPPDEVPSVFVDTSNWLPVVEFEFCDLG